MPTRAAMHLFSEKFACPVSGFTIPEIEPRLFSFNNPFGACPTCGGLGVEQHIDAELVIPDKDATLRKGAIAPWAKSSSPYYMQTLEALGKHYKFTLDTKWKDLAKKTQDAILYGSGEDEIKFAYDDGLRSYDDQEAVRGRHHQSRAPLQRDRKRMGARGAAQVFHRRALRRLQRLPPQAGSAVRQDRRQAHRRDLRAVGARAPATGSSELPEQLNKQQNEIAARILKEIRDRLRFLLDVGLDYLTLAARLRHAVRRREPAHSPGLADRLGPDRRALCARRAVDRPASARQCAPAGDAEAAARSRQHRDRGRARRGRDPPRRLRGRHRPRRRHPWRPHHRAGHARRHHDATGIADRQISHRRDDGCRCPSGARRTSAARSRSSTRAATTSRTSRPKSRSACSPAVTGVSGGGKSTLLIDTLYKAIARKLNNASEAPAPHDRIEGLEHIDKIIDIDQSPIGRTPRSNPATYTGAFTPIREWFAGLPEAKARGYEPGRFSFNVKGGRCEACQGDGVIKIEMHFLPDVYVTCDACKGKRYNRETLEVLFKGKSIADVLDMTVEEGAEFFKAVPRVRDILDDAAPRRPRLHPCRPAGDDAVRRRGAARQARQGVVEARHRPHALHSRRADHRPAFPRRREAARSAARAGRAAATRWW